MNFSTIPIVWLGLTSGVYLLGLVTAALVASAEFTIGFGAGGALALGNSWASARKVKQADFPDRGRVTASLVGGFYLRLALVGLCLYGFIKILKMNAVGVVAGLSVVPAGLFILLILIYFANRTPKEV